MVGTYADRTRLEVAGYLAAIHDGQPVRVRQRYTTAALLDLAEYLAQVYGDRSDTMALRYLTAIVRMQEEGDLVIEEVCEGGNEPRLAALVYSYVRISLSPGLLKEVQK